MAPPPPPERGFILAGRYLLNSLLGQGGMGLVYRAEHLGLGVEVAVKIMGGNAYDDPEGDLRFQREARLAATLNHPHAVRVFDFGAADGYLFLAMPLLHGETLRQRLARTGRLPVDDVCWVGAQVASALTAAHDVALIHRDVKPDNVFLERLPDGREHAVVMDFGLAVPVSEQGELTRHGEVFGTPHYMSPEQARGRPLQPTTDVYALGCVLFELLSGAPPFPGKSIEVLTKHLVEPAPPLQGRAGQPIPPVLDRLVTRMLRKRPEERPDMGAVHATLEGLTQRGLSLDSGPAPRVARMVDPGVRAEPDVPVDGRLRVLGGALPDDVRLALRAQHIVALAEDDPSEADVVLWLGARPSQVATWPHGAPLLVDTDPIDAGRISALLRAGAAGVVLQPLGVEGVLKAVQRALKRRRR
ncbi:MAG: serine/threonine protein kinase [Myxococcales bacterium]|nr:serine/threonine protein kinase [Myxococcales bacterium]MCB9524930.1 serine/threonine protein kinase [Myxococcales bacterium]